MCNRETLVEQRILMSADALHAKEDQCVRRESTRIASEILCNHRLACVRK